MPFLQTLGGGSATGFSARITYKYYTQTFSYTGAVQSFTIPSGTQNITAHVFGPGGSSDAALSLIHI